jgi:hypothetical protein
MMYCLHVNAQGDIRSYGVGMPDSEDPSLKYILVTDEYAELFKDIIEGKKKLGSYKVNLESSVLKLYEKNSLSELDPTFNRFINVGFLPSKTTFTSDLLFSFVSKNNRLYASLKYFGSTEYIKNLKQHSITFYATGKNNIHDHYETFYFNFDQFNEQYEIELPVQEVDPDIVYSNNLSLFTRKLFKNITYTIT